MQRITLVGCSAICCAMAGGCSNDANVKETAALEGEWAFVAIESDGYVSSPEEIKGQRWSIKGSEITGIVPGVPDHKMAYKLDASKTPKQMDLMPLYDPYKGTVDPAIYSLESGKLRVCARGPDELQKGRPTEFTEAMVFEKVTR